MHYRAHLIQCATDIIDDVRESNHVSENIRNMVADAASGCRKLVRESVALYDLFVVTRLSQSIHHYLSYLVPSSSLQVLPYILRSTHLQSYLPRDASVVLPFLLKLRDE